MGVMLGSLSLPVAIAAAFGLAFAESGLGVGLVFPGETAVLVIAATMPTWATVSVLFAAVACGASAGDHVGYWLGRKHRSRLRESKIVAKMGRQHWDRATDALRENGAAAVFMTRLIPIVRTLSPAAAGASGLPYRRFLPASIAGSVLWSGLYVGVGTAAGASIQRVQEAVGAATWGVAAIVGAVTVTMWVMSKAPHVPREPVRVLRAGGMEPHRADLAASLVGSLAVGDLQP